VNNTLQRKDIKGQKFRSVLCLSDQHHPYEHKDLMPFLKELNNKYKFDLVVNLGDEVDNHAISFHESEPELFSPGQELAKAIESLQPLYKLFPKMEVIDSNHGSLVFRKGKYAQLPSSVFKSSKEILKAPRGWNWSSDLTIQTELGPVYFHHGKSGQAGKLSRNMAMNTVQGHFHSKFQIDYWGSPAGLFWDMHAGCVVDDKSLAMAYNKTTLQRPVIGLGVIINGRPQLVPMHLDKRHRWTGRL
jgi:predicted MPP superfamily phosphohydrolase